MDINILIGAAKEKHDMERAAIIKRKASQI